MKFAHIGKTPVDLVVAGEDSNSKDCNLEFEKGPKFEHSYPDPK